MITSGEPSGNWKFSKGVISFDTSEPKFDILLNEAKFRHETPRFIHITEKRKERGSGEYFKLLQKPDTMSPGDSLKQLQKPDTKVPPDPFK